MLTPVGCLPACLCVLCRQCTPWAVVDTLEARFLEHLRTALKASKHTTGHIDRGAQEE